MEQNSNKYNNQFQNYSNQNQFNQQINNVQNNSQNNGQRLNNSNKRKYMLIAGPLILLVVLVGITYAFFNYTRTGALNSIRVGEIYFNTEQGTAINLSDMFPIEVTQANLSDPTKVGTVVIDVIGNTDYSNGVEYLVTAVNVTNTVGSGANQKNIPISVSVSYDEAENETIGTEDANYFANRGGNTSRYKILAEDTILNNDPLVVGYIAPGSTRIDGTITIKAYLDASKIAISDTYDESNPGTDNMGTTSNWVNNRVVLTTNEWNSLQTNGVSFQVKVEANEGTWVNEPEPRNVTPDRCFDTMPSYIATLNSNLSQDQINSCVNYLTDVWGAEVEGDTVREGETYESFCAGTGEVWWNTFQGRLDHHDFEVADVEFFQEHGIVNAEIGVAIRNYDTSCGGDLVIPRSLPISEINDNMTQEEMNDCISYITSLNWSWETGETPEAFCAGTGTHYGDNIQQAYFSSEERVYLRSHNIITFDEDERYSVIEIGVGSSIFPSPQNMFALSSLVLNNNLLKISSYAFNGSTLPIGYNLIIPSSVNYIDYMSLVIYAEGYNDGNSSNGLSLSILGKPYISYLAINDDFNNITYGGTCQELYANSPLDSTENKPYCIYGYYTNNIITTDTNTCSVIGDVD